MLELRSVLKSLGGIRVVGPLDLAVARGRVTVLIGPSGCGKSTVLRLICGLLAPDAGTVLFDGSPVSPESAAALRRRMGYVIQDGGLFPHLTARRNAALMAEYLGWDQRRISERLIELAAVVRLAEALLERYPAELSGGQRQRVSLMRALMLDPDVLLMDEPLGALDPMVRSELQGDLQVVFRQLGKTVVMVTHDIGEAAWFADAIVLLREGRIVQQGTLLELVASPADPFVTAFINAQRSHLETLGGSTGRAGAPS